MLKVVAFLELILCWVAWSLAFVKPRKQAAGRKKVARAPVSKWGILLVMVGFALTWSFVRPVGFEKSTPSLIASMCLGPPSVALAWAATRHLGKQWRYEAALSEDHELIQTGPYRWIRHPNLRIDVRHAVGYGCLLDLVADVYCFNNGVPGGHRDSCSRGGPPARRTFQGFIY